MGAPGLAWALMALLTRHGVQYPERRSTLAGAGRARELDDGIVRVEPVDAQPAAAEVFADP